ncbi:MAG TPA: M15 family metallopeptidase [Candidatus Omnitrophota bacterium]|nr:M15 family metallopeptidase [Candidatus Omnitrophota bacterium]
MFKFDRSGKLKKTVFIVAGCFFLVPVFFAFAAIDLDSLSQKDINMVRQVLAKLEPMIREREANSTLATLTFEELYACLDEEESQFLKEFQELDAKALNVSIPFRGMATGEEPLVKIAGQRIAYIRIKKGSTRELGVQYLPSTVYEKYKEMMQAMQKDIGKNLLVESGYRSSAYQLYLFVYYLKNHKYSIRETVKFVALPGYSEHGAPLHQAVDFINEYGINGEYNTKEFEDLPEYRWLLAHAGEFGFVLSYPKMEKGSGITFEPWHWRYDAPGGGA